MWFLSFSIQISNWFVIKIIDCRIMLFEIFRIVVGKPHFGAWFGFTIEAQQPNNERPTEQWLEF